MQNHQTSRKRSLPKIGTAALPDIIFMLLFFFMVTTVLRENQLLVKFSLPQATELQKLEHRSLVHHLFIGKAADPQMSSATVIQLNDAFIKVERIEDAIRALILAKPPHLHKLIHTSLKIDREVSMGIVDDVKLQLRKADQLRVNYAALPHATD